LPIRKNLSLVQTLTLEKQQLIIRKEREKKRGGEKVIVLPMLV